LHNTLQGKQGTKFAGAVVPPEERGNSDDVT
jgi:hypothetical protein